MVLAVLFFALLGVGTSQVYAADALADTYNRITDGLIAIRKQFPVVQPRVYALLDQVDKLYKAAKANTLEVTELKKKLAERQQELQQTETAKKSAEQARITLAKQCEEQSNKLQALQVERDRLVAKVQLAAMAPPAGQQPKGTKLS